MTLGAQVLEFVVAHSYLMHQFLSPLSNESTVNNLDR